MSVALRPLTPRQRQVLDFIISHSRRLQYPPTIREIAASVYHPTASTNAVHDVLRSLVKKGYVEVDSMVSRGIRVLERAA